MDSAPTAPGPGALRKPLIAILRHSHIGALVAGSLAACGFQPLAWWPLTILGVVWLIELVGHAHRARRAFLLGWLFGLAHFTIGDNWIATAFTYQAQMPAWLGGIAVVLLSLYLAVFPGVATLGAWLLARGFGAERTPGRVSLGIALAGCWIVTEWMRAWVFTGFAWNPLGVALLGPFASQGLALLTPWIGTYGLSGVLVLIAALGHHAIRSARASNGSTRAGWLAGAGLLAVGLTALMLLPAGYLDRQEGEIRYTLIQPDLRQETLDDPRNFEPHFIKMARLTMPKDRGERRLVLWPESGLADYLRDGYPDYFYRQMTYEADPVLARRRIGQVIGPYSLLLTGAVDLVMKNDDAVAARNSVTAIDGRGNILDGYSKAHLVPYGEYLALRWLLEPLGATRLVPGALDFWPGPGPRTSDFGTLGKAGIQICYEIVFSGEVVDRRERPDYIFNPSNDGWFGSWGPPQHLAQARLRAIEEGLPVLRSTTTGISAVIDADGLVRQFAPMHLATRLDGKIPPAHEPTLFARFGNALPLALAVLLLVLSVVARRRRRA
ncbi:apolipoprotein N-acyltransferase [Novosphingobium chloroacetimidivorans]|uniref:Apolipoprotein N-acyltransferase n=1 Tax=Novosphingobium chloroacetimidivorans TaxID=1428314 RepID=A0A7W7K7D6_9SPHN|nr:apolipoprotein N-acyltransferase [Novosphingobium chloroacetimidivorans]MBB4857594.1 apolipoprotein N-acyltransferase [Novosphingobium chloroacetimidivorans]